MDEPLLIKYDIDESEGLDLGLLAESFGGLNIVFKELAKLTDIHGHIEVRTTKITHASIDLHQAIQITLTNGVPFASPQDLFNFLQVARPELLGDARAFFSGSLGVHRTINDYFAENPVDQSLLEFLAGAFFVKCVQWAKKQKVQLTTQDDNLGEISPPKARRLQRLVRTGEFRKILKPMTEGNVRSIKLMSASVQTQVEASIREADIEQYLPEDDRVLPQFENGAVYNFTGVLVNIQSAHGEILRIMVDGLPRKHALITARPGDQATTEDFVEFYHRDVTFSAEVVRASMYKRPEFVIREISLNQQNLDLEDQ